MAKGIILIESTKNYFFEMRNHKSHKKFYEEAEKVSRNLNIKLPSVQFKNKRIKKIPKNLEKFVCDSKIIEKQPLVTENEYRSNIRVFYCILDKIINEFDKRFSDNSNIINGISALNPESITFLSYDTIIPFAKAYSCDVGNLKSELNILLKSIQRYEIKNKSKISNIFLFYEFLNSYQIAFSETFKLCSIAITIPVSSAACERTFSCMKRIKNYLRNSLLDTNLSNLSLISIEKAEAKLLDIDEIINKFADAYGNRRIILY